MNDFKELREDGAAFAKKLKECSIEEQKSMMLVLAGMKLQRDITSDDEPKTA